MPSVGTELTGLVADHPVAVEIDAAPRMSSEDIRIALKVND